MSVQGPCGIGLHILFDRRIRRRVEGDLGVGRLAGFEARRAEIDQHRPARLVDQDVGRLDVAVQHADAMGAFKPFGDGPDEREQAFLVECLALLQHLRQRDAAFEVHHHVGGAVNFEQAADADDVGMARSGRDRFHSTLASSRNFLRPRS